MKRFFKKSGIQKITEQPEDPNEDSPPPAESIFETDRRHTFRGFVPFYDLGQLRRNLDTVRTSGSKTGKTAIESEENSASDSKGRDELEATGSTDVARQTMKSGNSARYIIHDQIGQGGTAVVYRATDRVMKRDIAFKQFRMSENGENGNYLSEIETISKITHPNVVITHDAGDSDKGLYIAMNLIEGLNLEQAIRKQGPYNLKSFKKIALQALEGLAEIHSKEIIHMDIKPSNIMATKYKSGNMHVQIVDFGSAIHTSYEGAINIRRPSKLHGSIHYMSPESFGKAELDVRSDIYSMGCVFYELLTGNKPFNDGSPVVIMADHLQNRYEKLDKALPGLPKEIVEIIGQMLSADREDRPGCVQEIISKLSATD